MRYQKLGNTDIDVSVIALGTWGLGGGSVWTDRDSTVEDTRNLLDICREYGVNYIDTAPVYGTGASEELLGRALKGRRQDFILQSKCSLNWRNEGGNFHYERDGYTVNNDTRASAVKKDVEDSLRRMGFYLGKFIYILDAYDDLEKDVKNGNYNPFAEKYIMKGFDEQVRRILIMMMAQTCREFEKLPIIKYTDILRNILYSGVWCRFETVSGKRKKEQEKEHV